MHGHPMDIMIRTNRETMYGNNHDLSLSLCVFLIKVSSMKYKVKICPALVISIREPDPVNFN